MKKILTALLVFLLILTATLPCFAEELPVYVDDEAGLLQQSQIATLSAKLKQIEDRYGLHLIVASVDDYFAPTIESLADTYFSSTAAGEQDGAVFLISMDTREWTMQGYGKGREIFSEDVLDLLENDCIDLLSNGDYYEAFRTFASDCDYVFELYRAGTPYETPTPWGKIAFMSVACGFGVALIIVLVMKGQLKSVRSRAEAREYVKKDSFKLNKSYDLFLYRTVTRRAIPKNNGGGGSRGGGGGRSGRF